MAYGLLVPQPGIEPVPLAVEAWSLNQWTIGEAQQAHFKNFVQAHFLTWSNRRWQE